MKKITRSRNGKYHLDAPANCNQNMKVSYASRPSVEAAHEDSFCNKCFWREETKKEEALKHA